MRGASRAFVRDPDSTRVALKRTHLWPRFSARAASSVNTDSTAASGTVRQAHLEASAVDPIMTLNDMIAATKGAEASAKLMQYHDHIMGQAVNTLGRVA